MAYKKKINTSKTGPKEGKKVKIKKDKKDELDIWVEFDNDNDANTYTVDALDTDVNAMGETDDTKLPYADSGGQVITWLNSFQITKGGKFLDNVWYSVLFNRSDVTDKDGLLFPFVYHDGQNLFTVTPETDREDASKVKIRLNKGDPSVGIIRPS